MPSFLLLGQSYSNTMSYFRDVLRESLPKHGGFILWMMVMLIPDVGMSQVDGDVYVLMIEKA